VNSIECELLQHLECLVRPASIVKCLLRLNKPDNRKNQVKLAELSCGTGLEKSGFLIPLGINNLLKKVTPNARIFYTIRYDYL
jgi:hypothetical protein